MIKVYKDWVVQVDDMCYALMRDLGRTQTNKKTGNVRRVYKTYGYYSSLGKALEALGEAINREALSEGEFTLEEAIAKIQETSQLVSDLITKHLGEV